jgi:antagonist of KipI
MADRQTIGGYPCLGHLIAADRPRAAQLWPGDEVRFLPVTLEAAHRAARDQAAALAAL